MSSTTPNSAHATAPTQAALPLPVPVVAYRMRNANGVCTLHYERERALQSAVDHRGTVTELIELTPALRALLALVAAAAPSPITSIATQAE